LPCYCGNFACLLVHQNCLFNSIALESLAYGYSPQQSDR
jgi:hypothetical protein